MLSNNNGETYLPIFPFLLTVCFLNHPLNYLKFYIITCNVTQIKSRADNRKQQNTAAREKESEETLNVTYVTRTS